MVRITGMDAGESCQFNGNIHAVSSEDTVDATGIGDTSGSFFSEKFLPEGILMLQAGFVCTGILQAP